MKRWVILLSLAAALLLCANLVVAFAAAEPRFVVDAAEVLHVEQRHLPLEARFSDTPQRPNGRYYFYTDPADIALFCDVFATMYLREFPYDRLDTAQQELAQKNAHITLYTFYLRDGSVREVYLGSMGLLHFDDHWCYASCGEAYGYKPIFSLLSNAHNNAERLEEGSP